MDEKQAPLQKQPINIFLRFLTETSYTLYYFYNQKRLKKTPRNIPSILNSIPI